MRRLLCLLFCGVSYEGLPYIYMYKSVAAAAVLTHDKDHSAMGVPTVTLDFVLSVRSYARNAAVHVSVMLGSTAIVAGTLMAAVSLVKGLILVAQRLPKGVLIALGIGAAIVALHPSTREKTITLAGRAMRPLRRVGETTLAAAADVLAAGHQAGNAANEAGLQARQQMRPARRTARSVAFAVLAASASPLPFDRLLSEMRRAGYKSRGKNPSAYIRRVLRADHRLLETGKGWQVAHAA